MVMQPTEGKNKMAQLVADYEAEQKKKLQIFYDKLT
jgi:hypothetical protein